MNNEFKWDETLCFNFKLVEQSHVKFTFCKQNYVRVQVHMRTLHINLL